MRKGSVTVFVLLSVVLMVSVLLALLEGSRFYYINRFTQMQSQTAIESVFAKYNTYLWEQYRLLACKQETILGDIEKYGSNQISEDNFGTNFYQFLVKEVQVEGYTRLTDGDGEGFLQAVSRYMEKNLLYETAKEIYGQYEGIKNLQNNSDFDLGDIDTALKNMEEETSSTGTSAVVTSRAREETQQSAGENLLQVIKDLQKKGILALVLEEDKSLSDKKIDKTNVVSKRELPEAFSPKLEETDWYDTVLLQQYLLSYMSNYTESKEHEFCYELEYLLGGKESETENLRSVVNQLLAIRESANFMYLVSNPQKSEQAQLFATAMVGVSLNPVLIETVKMAVLAAWAFAESILDIRTLLTGGKIALIKNDTSWTMDLDSIKNLGHGYAKAKSSENGLDYTQYAGLLLFFQDEHVLAKRAMDMQEITLRQLYKDETICMEDWIFEARMSITYVYKPVFYSIQHMVSDFNYQITVHQEYGY